MLQQFEVHVGFNVLHRCTAVSHIHMYLYVYVRVLHTCYALTSNSDKPRIACANHGFDLCAHNPSIACTILGLSKELRKVCNELCKVCVKSMYFRQS